MGGAGSVGRGSSPRLGLACRGLDSQCGAVWGCLACRTGSSREERAGDVTSVWRDPVWSESSARLGREGNGSVCHLGRGWIGLVCRCGSEGAGGARLGRSVRSGMARRCLGCRLGAEWPERARDVGRGRADEMGVGSSAWDGVACWGLVCRPGRAGMIWVGMSLWCGLKRCGSARRLGQAWRGMGCRVAVDRPVG
jgi:hypothetical protein